MQKQQCLNTHHPMRTGELRPSSVRTLQQDIDLGRHATAPVPRQEALVVLKYYMAILSHVGMNAGVCTIYVHVV